MKEEMSTHRLHNRRMLNQAKVSKKIALVNENREHPIPYGHPVNFEIIKVTPIEVGLVKVEVRLDKYAAYDPEVMKKAQLKDYERYSHITRKIKLKPVKELLNDANWAVKLKETPLTYSVPLQLERVEDVNAFITEQLCSIIGVNDVNVKSLEDGLLLVTLGPKDVTGYGSFILDTTNQEIVDDNNLSYTDIGGAQILVTRTDSRPFLTYTLEGSLIESTVVEVRINGANGDLLDSIDYVPGKTIYEGTKETTNKNVFVKLIYPDGTQSATTKVAVNVQTAQEM